MGLKGIITITLFLRCRVDVDADPISNEFAFKMKDYLKIAPSSNFGMHTIP